VVLSGFHSKRWPELSIDSLVAISGYNESTKIAPLLQAFETINLNSTLPGLKSDLLSSAKLTGKPLVPPS
jgi:hypothetical protein